jgi:translocation and assembly module TamB
MGKIARRDKRVLLMATAVVCGGAGILFALVYTLQTSWFKQQVREKIVSAAEQASGGRVELGAFNYSWRSLTAEFKGFVVHGTEARNARPLFRAASLTVALRPASLLSRNVDIRLLQIERPEVHVEVRPDGSTNLPRENGSASASHLVEQLFALKVRRFEFIKGLLELNEQRVPLTARGHDLTVLLSYEPGAPGYNVSLSSRTVEVHSHGLHNFSGGLTANAHLEPDRLLVTDLFLTSGASKLNARGAIMHFAHPTADFSLDAQLAGEQVAGLLGLSNPKSGELALNGTFHYDDRAAFKFEGRLHAHDVVYSSREVVLKNLDMTSHVVATPARAAFTQLALHALGGTITGNAEVTPDRDLKFSGKFSGWNTRQVSAFRRVRGLPWSGLASGTLQVEGTLGRSNFTIRTAAHIVSGTGGVPISGDVELTYKQPESRLSFGNSHLNLPKSQISFSGTVGQTVDLVLDSSDLDDLKPALAFTTSSAADVSLPVIRNNGTTHFQGTVSGPFSDPYIQGDLAATRFEFQKITWGQVRSRIKLARGGIDFSSLAADSSLLHINGSGHAGFENWTMLPTSPIRLNVQFQRADLARISSSYFALKLPLLRGSASGALNLGGSISDPRGSIHLSMDNLNAYGERVNTVQVDALLEANRVRVTQGRMRAGPALLAFSGTYQHSSASWQAGQLALKVDSNGFPLASLAPIHNYEPALQASVELHLQGTLQVTPEQILPAEAGGNLIVRGITIASVPYGSLAARVNTHGKTLDADLTGKLRDTQLSGSAHVQLTPGLPGDGELRLDGIGLRTLYVLATANSTETLPLDGFLRGGVTFSGPLERIDELHGTVQIDQLQVSSTVPITGETRPASTDLIFRNAGPIVMNAANGIATIRSFELSGKDTKLSVRGLIPYVQHRSLDLNLRGSADLRLLQIFDPNVRSSGQSVIATSVTGTLQNPAISGTLQVKNGSFFLDDIPNGLTGVNGVVNFDRDRAAIQTLTAQTGGGEVSLGGLVTYGGGPLVYRLQGSAENVRLRYSGGTSATANADLQLTGTSENSVLSGTVTVSRIGFNPNTDIGTLLASVAAHSVAPANEKDFFTGLQFDIHIESARDLEVNSALSRDIQGDIDLHLRGTPGHPLVLGSASVNQGEIKVFGTKYSINRGEVSFINPVKIEPVLNLDLQTQARGISIGINITGPLGKLNINYRSDPPLQPRDIIALLTVGHTPDIAANISGQQSNADVTALQSGANTVLGAVASPSSSRLQRFFGVANIKIDPMVQGITNTMQRLTIEQQISRDITVTYVTNLSQTSEQIFRLEWALSPQYSIVALRDDNGEFGIDLQYKKRFK